MSSGLVTKTTPLKVRRKKAFWQLVYMQDNEEKALPLSNVTNARTIHIEKKIVIEVRLFHSSQDIEEAKKVRTFNLTKTQSILASNFIQAKLLKTRPVT